MIADTRKPTVAKRSIEVADASTVRQSRRPSRLAEDAVRCTCRRYKVPSHATEDAAAVASELVAASMRETDGAVRLEVFANPASVGIRVSDAGRHAPLAPATSLQTARCWELARHLSHSYGYRRIRGGRQAWALIVAEKEH